MNKFLPIILFSLIPLNGCSAPENEPELSYDPIEVIEYQNCLNNPPPYLGGLFNPPRDWAIEACEDKRPVAK